MTENKDSIFPYGCCPICGLPGVTRERRPNGNDRCEDGHTYPSSNAKPYEPIPQNEGTMNNITTVGELISYLNKLEPHMKIMGAKGTSNAPSCWSYSFISDVHIIPDTNIFIGDNKCDGSSVLVIRQK